MSDVLLHGTSTVDERTFYLYWLSPVNSLTGMLQISPADLRYPLACGCAVGRAMDGWPARAAPLHQGLTTVWGRKVSPRAVPRTPPLGASPRRWHAFCPLIGQPSDKGIPSERVGRKASGLRLALVRDRVAELPGAEVLDYGRARGIAPLALHQEPPRVRGFVATKESMYVYHPVS